MSDLSTIKSLSYLSRRVSLFSLSVALYLCACTRVHEVYVLETVSQVVQRTDVETDQPLDVLRANFDLERDQWTRTSEVFHHFEGRLFVTATMITPALELARTKYHQSALSLLPSEFNQLMKQRLDRLKSSYVFFITLSSSDLPKLQKPNLARDSLVGEDGLEEDFQVHFLVNQRKITVNKIDQLSFKRAQNLKDDFPFISAVKTGYWISFNRTENLKDDNLKREIHSLILRFSNPSATAILPWRVKIQ